MDYYTRRLVDRWERDRYGGRNERIVVLALVGVATVGALLMLVLT